MSHRWFALYPCLQRVSTEMPSNRAMLDLEESRDDGVDDMPLEVHTSFN